MSARWAVIVAAVGIAGCGGRKQHLIEGKGTSYYAAFDGQAVRREHGPATPVAGLDSQEAAIVSQSYRTRLAPKETKPVDQPILMVAPTHGAAQPLAPSVPKER